MKASTWTNSWSFSLLLCLGHQLHEPIKNSGSKDDPMRHCNLCHLAELRQPRSLKHVSNSRFRVQGSGFIGFRAQGLESELHHDDTAIEPNHRKTAHVSRSDQDVVSRRSLQQTRSRRPEVSTSELPKSRLIQSRWV